jgi:plasmid stabilization system protein ParE
MMSYRVSILAKAHADVDRVYTWISQRSIAGAVRWYAAFFAAARSLAENPESCSLAPESELLPYTIRQRFFRTRRGRIYRMLFTIVDDEVRVLRVRGPGQPPLEQLG